MLTWGGGSWDGGDERNVKKKVSRGGTLAASGSPLYPAASLVACVAAD